MNLAYTWDDYVYAVNDVLLGSNKPGITQEDAKILGVCYDGCYREQAAAVAVLTDRLQRKQ